MARRWGWAGFGDVPLEDGAVAMSAVAIYFPLVLKLVVQQILKLSLFLMGLLVLLGLVRLLLLQLG